MARKTRNDAGRSRGIRGGLLLVILAALFAAAIPVTAVGQAAPSEKLLVPNAVEVIVDRVAPTPGKAAGPSKTNKLPVALTYSGASDAEGSGVESVTLWMKNGAQGTWASAGATGTGTSGSLSFSGATTDGTYYFALRAKDYAGNESPVPQGTGDLAVLIDRKPPTITLNGSASVWLEQGATYTDAGATAKDDVDGDLTSKLQVENSVDTSQGGEYRVTYRVTDSSGNEAVVSRTVNVAKTYALTLTPPAQGRLEANPAPSAGGKYSDGTVVTVSYVADSLAGADVGAWTGAQQDAAAHNLGRVTMTEDRTVSVTLTRHTGKAIVDVTPNTGTWRFTDGDGKVKNGAGDLVMLNVPTGKVSIAYNAVDGMTAPEPEEAVLAKGAQVSFRGSYTDGNATTVSLLPELQAAPGATVTCPIKITNATALTNYQVRVTFTADAVEAVEASAGSLTSGWSGPVFTAGDGEFTVSGTATSGATGSGTLAVVQLRVKDTAQPGATTPLHLAAISLNDGAITATGTDGALTVNDTRFVWGDVSGDGTAGDSDAALVLQRRVGLLAQFSSDAAEQAANVSGEIPAVVGAYDAALMLKRASGAVQAFPADADGDGMGPEAEGSEVVATPLAGVRNVALNVGVDAEPGAPVVLPILVDNGADILGCYAQLAYSTDAVEFLGAARGTLGAAWTAPLVNATPGVIAVVGAGAESKTGNGSLFVLNFRARMLLTSDMTIFRLDAIELNDGLAEVKVTTQSGVPALDGVTPGKGAQFGGTVVTLRGGNLGSVTQVLFGGVESPWAQYDPRRGTISAVVPAGTGTVDVEAVAPGGSATLTAGFEYFVPAVYLKLSPLASVNAGAAIDVPVSLDTTSTGRPTSVSFRLKFDRDLFAVRQNASKAMAVVGDAAKRAGKTVAVRVVAPGELLVTVTGSPSTTMQPGVLCTVQLVALGDTTSAMGLMHISETSATGLQSKSLSAGGGVSE